MRVGCRRMLLSESSDEVSTSFGTNRFGTKGATGRLPRPEEKYYRIKFDSIEIYYDYLQKNRMKKILYVLY